MSVPAAPFKTSSGLEELQLRTRRLGQRHRTILLLVDGRRPLGEILGMANRAGADTRHFEDLVRLGLVEVPRQGLAVPPRDTGPVPLDLPTSTPVAFDALEVPPEPPDVDPAAVQIERVIRVADDLPRPKRRKAVTAIFLEPVQLRELAETATEPPHDDGPDTVANPEVEPMPTAKPSVPPSSREALDALPVLMPEPVPLKTRESPKPRDIDAVTGSPTGGPPPPPPPAPAPAPAPAPDTPAPTASPATSPAPPAPIARRGKRARARVPPDATPALVSPSTPTPTPRPASVHDAQRHEVRSLLMGAMGAESALFAPMTLSRLRHADTPRDFIAVVWEIERQRNHVNRSRAQLFSLERARELLGMGNTVVAGDTPADTTWPDTQGG